MRALLVVARSRQKKARWKHGNLAPSPRWPFSLHTNMCMGLLTPYVYHLYVDNWSEQSHANMAVRWKRSLCHLVVSWCHEMTRRWWGRRIQPIHVSNHSNIPTMGIAIAKSTQMWQWHCSFVPFALKGHYLPHWCYHHGSHLPPTVENQWSYTSH
jgi:hypothetical protein